MLYHINIDANILEEYSRYILCPTYLAHCAQNIFDKTNIGLSLGNLWLEVLDELVAFLVHKPEIEIGHWVRVKTNVLERV